MATTKFIDTLEGTYGLEAYSSTAGTVTVESTVIRANHGRSIKCNTSNPAVGANVFRSGVLADAGRRISFYFRFTTAPSAAAAIATLFAAGGANGIIGIRLTTANKLALYNNATTLYATGTQILSVDTWYRVTLSYTITSASSNHFKVWIDGAVTPDIDLTDVTSLDFTGSDTLRLGIGVGAGTDHIAYYSDVYVDDGTDLADPGNINLTGKLPSGVNANNFDTTGGNGAVNERPISETNYKEQASSSSVQQNYTLQTAAEGDFDLTGATIVAYTTWLWSKRGAITPCTHRESAAGNGTNPSTSDTITIPAGTATGDSLFVGVTSRDHTSGSAYPTVTDDDSGGNTWTMISESPDGSRRATLWWKRATAGTASKTITVAGCIGSMTCGVSVFQNASTSNTPYTNISAEDNASGNETHASITPDYAGSTLCFSVSNYNNDNAVTNVAGATIGSYTQRYEKQSTGGSDCANTIWSVDGTDTAPAATGAVTWSQTNGVTTTFSWAVRPEDTVGSPKIMSNGVETAITLSTASALYTLITDSASYPSNVAGVGETSTGSVADTFLYDCGIVIAYIPAAGAAAAFQPAWTRNTNQLVRGA